MGMGDVSISGLVLIFQIFSSSQSRIKPGNVISSFSACHGTDLSIISYRFAEPLVAVAAISIQEFVSNLLNLILRLVLGMALDALLHLCCDILSLSIYWRDTRVLCVASKTRGE